MRQKVDRARTETVLVGLGLLFPVLFGVLGASHAEAQEPSQVPQPFTPEPAEACEGKEPGASCWMEIADRQGCYTWNPNLAAAETTVSWSGECSGGLAQGTGLQRWSHPDDEGNPLVDGGEGELRGGKPHGPWSHYSSDGGLSEGSYADGEKHGGWMEVYPDGTVFHGEYAEGQRRGRWASTKGGDAGGGFYVAGRRHGQWKVFGVDTNDETVGWVAEGLYVTGSEDGRWVVRFDEGTVFEFTYRTGVLHGASSSRYSSGAMQEGLYVDGKKHGEWTYNRSNGNRLRSGKYVDGEREGTWREYGEDGELREHGEYKKGKKHGEWTARQPSGAVTKHTWAEGSLAGPYSHSDSSGVVVEEGSYGCRTSSCSSVHARDLFKTGTWKEEGHEPLLELEQAGGWWDTNWAMTTCPYTTCVRERRRGSWLVTYDDKGTRIGPARFSEPLAPSLLRATTYFVEGEFVNGLAHGQWRRGLDRDDFEPYWLGDILGLLPPQEEQQVETAPFEAGRRIGPWIRTGYWELDADTIDRSTDVPTEEGTYDKNGLKHGYWYEGIDDAEERWYYFGLYVSGKRHGPWKPRFRGFNGEKEDLFYVHGSRVSLRQWRRWQRDN